MMVKYSPAPDLEGWVRRVVEGSSLSHIDPSRVKCVRSFGSRSRNLYARIHSASKAFFTGMRSKPSYVIEFISESFDALSEDEKERVIIHELLHIPRSFGGGLIGHGRLDFEREVEDIRRLMQRRGAPPAARL